MDKEKKGPWDKEDFVRGCLQKREVKIFLSQGGSYTFESGLALLIYYSTYPRSLGGPESIMSCMMLSGLPRLVGGLHSLFSSFKESRWARKHHVPHDAFQSTATCICSSSSTSSSISRWARKRHVLHDAFWSTAT